MILASLCVALAELVAVLLLIVVFEFLQPSSNRFSGCARERRRHTQKGLTNASDISDKDAP